MSSKSSFAPFELATVKYFEDAVITFDEKRAHIFELVERKGRDRWAVTAAEDEGSAGHGCYCAACHANSK